MSAAFKCYQEYVSLKRHFASRQYDYFKYSGKLKISEQSLEARNDRAFFYRLAKEGDPQKFFIANFLENKDSWVGDLTLSKESLFVFKNWKRKQDSLAYVFKSDLNQLDENFNDNFKTNKGLPKIVKLFIQKKIQLETLCILYYILNLDKKWLDKISDPLYNDIELKIQKYHPFLNYDRKKFKDLVKEKFTK